MADPLGTVNLKSGIVRHLAPFSGVQARFVAANPDFPNELLIGLNLKDRRTHNVYRIDLKTGAVVLDTGNPGNVVGWTADRQFKVRAATATTPDGGFELFVREASDGAWKTMRRWGPDDQGRAAGFSADGKTLYIIAGHDANAMRLLELDVATGREMVIDEDLHAGSWLAGVAWAQSPLETPSQRLLHSCDCETCPGHA